MLSRQEFFSRARRGPYTTEELYSAYEAYATCPAFPGAGDFRCERCGRCCRRPWRIEPSVRDVQRWIREGRLDIIRRLEHAPRPGPPAVPAPCEAGDPGPPGPVPHGMDGDLAAAMVFAAREGELVVPKTPAGCIYYDGDGCTIYGTRPGVCSLFPDAGRFSRLAALIGPKPRYKK